MILRLLLMAMVWGGTLEASQIRPLPRFASIKAKEANWHVGPGKQYPVEWTYVRRNLPVQIIAEFDVWRQVRDHQGTQGWVHQSLLSGVRYVVVLAGRNKLLAAPESDAKTIAYVEQGVVARAKKCRKHWCQINANGTQGWIKRKHIWGVFPHETTF